MSDTDRQLLARIDDTAHRVMITADLAGLRADGDTESVCDDVLRLLSDCYRRLRPASACGVCGWCLLGMRCRRDRPA